MEREQTHESFAKASKPMPHDSELMTRDGVLRVKRNVLGFFGCQSVKSIDELARILVDTHIASSEEEAKTIIPELNGKGFSYDGAYGDSLHFDREGTSYKIWVSESAIC